MEGTKKYAFAIYNTFSKNYLKFNSIFGNKGSLTLERRRMGKKETKHIL